MIWPLSGAEIGENRSQNWCGRQEHYQIKTSMVRAHDGHLGNR